ncbi:MAG: hypothetical protein AAGH99_10375 [Planctomycetota bacterium]
MITGGKAVFSEATVRGLDLDNIDPSTFSRVRAGNAIYANSFSFLDPNVPIDLKIEGGTYLGGSVSIDPNSNSDLSFNPEPGRGLLVRGNENNRAKLTIEDGYFQAGARDADTILSFTHAGLEAGLADVVIRGGTFRGSEFVGTIPPTSTREALQPADIFFGGGTSADIFGGDFRSVDLFGSNIVVNFYAEFFELDGEPIAFGGDRSITVDTRPQEITAGFLGQDATTFTLDRTFGDRDVSNVVRLILIPEPTSLGLVGLCVGTMLCSRGPRKR